jgi:hypothetical protein
MNQREILTSGQDSGGVWHAFYASASRTLCNVARPERGEDRHAHEPTCETCVTTARAFDRIDSSCPPHWFRGAVLEEVAVVERLGPDAAAASSSTGWTREAIIEALQRYGATHGGVPPRSGDWALYEVGRPTSNKIVKVFGSWADAVEAAGFPRPRPGVSPTLLAAVSERTEEAGPSPAETESRGLARMAPGKTSVRSEVVAAPDSGGGSHDSTRGLLRLLVRETRRVADTMEAFVDAYERELLEAAESEAA